MSTSTEITLIPKSPAEVAKAIAYIALTALAILRTSLTDHHVDATELTNIVLAVVTIIPIYLLAGTLVKTVVAFASAALQAIVVVLGGVLGFGQITFDDWIGITLAAFAAIGIAIIPNKPLIDARETGNVTTL